MAKSSGGGVGGLVVAFFFGFIIGIAFPDLFKDVLSSGAQFRSPVTFPG